MKDPVVGHQDEFEELIGSLSESVQGNDALTIGAMLYSIAEERKNTNLIIRDLNAKFDRILSKVEKIEESIGSKQQNKNYISDRDREVLEYVKTKDMICADMLQKKFQYKGKNAASARLSKLFHEGLLEKEYAGRKVYYKTR